jgi:hypothetical protein
MEFKLLETKPIITNLKDGVEIVDLINPSVRYDNTQYNIIDYFYVGDDMEMRPDLISYVSYSNQDDWDKILKFNGISNPFSIAQGDLIYIPDLFWMENQIVDNSGLADSDYSLSSAIDSTKKAEIDKKRLEYDSYAKQLLSINKNAVLVKEQLTPNMAKSGDSEITIVGNQIYL